VLAQTERCVVEVTDWGVVGARGKKGAALEREGDGSRAIGSECESVKLGGRKREKAKAEGQAQVKNPISADSTVVGKCLVWGATGSTTRRIVMCRKERGKEWCFGGKSSHTVG
jgi:hypothetical protein